MKLNRFFLALLISIAPLSLLLAQTAPWHQQTLLPDSIINYFIDEASGEMAMQHCIAMAAYNRNRPEEEYQHNYLEADYVLAKAKEYGFDTVEIEYFDADSIWDGEEGELWEISPRHRKIADYDDQTAVLVKGSKSTDIIAELVYVGRGTSARDYDSLDVKGKIVLGYGRIGSIYKQAVAERGALGIISFSSYGPLEDVDQIPWQRLKDFQTFGFSIGKRRGIALRDRLEGGEKITVRALVKASLQPNKHNVVSATIKGRDFPDESIIFSAHLFEGIIKQGANDDISGSASLLEIGRMLLRLMDDGVIERPRRTIRFLWVPEFAGTIPWVKAHSDLIENTLVNINLDMVGLHLSKSGSRFNLERTPFSRPSYLNDVVESVMLYVKETNWKTLHSRRFTNPIIAHSGSKDPFYCAIDYHFGASDHVVFNDWGVGVPGIMLITWPDNWYHSSEDRPDKLDETQLKRVAFISAVSAYVIADADDKMVVKIGAEIYSNGLHRMSREYQRAAEMLNHAELTDLASVYKRAKNVVKVAVDQEKRTLLSLTELAGTDKQVRKYIDALAKEIESRHGVQLQNQLKNYYQLICKMNGRSAVEPSLTAEEKRARKIIPRPTEKVKGWFDRKWISSVVDQSVQDSLNVFTRQVSRELRSLIDGKRNALEITQVLNAEFEKFTEIKEVLNYLELLRRADLVKL